MTRRWWWLAMLGACGVAQPKKPADLSQLSGKEKADAIAKMSVDEQISALIQAQDNRVARIIETSLKPIVKILASVAESLKNHHQRLLRLEATKRNPGNNECPVCGTMAEKFVVKKPTNCVSMPRDNMPIFSSGIASCPPEHEPHLLVQRYDQNLTRCTHCNAAFWQDAV